jgi:hypothetical protein
VHSQESPQPFKSLLAFIYEKVSYALSSSMLSYSYKICTINFRSNYLVTFTFSLSHLPSTLINGLGEVVRSEIDNADFIEA